MRVPTNSNSTQMLEQIQTLSARQARLQTQVSTGQRIFQPEDDPAAVGRVLTLEAERRQLSQFESNTNYALDLSKASYSGINEIKKISDRAGELATLGVGNIGADAMKTYATEVDQLIEQGLQLANSKLRNNYLYAGTNVDTTPFVESRDADGKITSVAYAGNSTQATIQISETATIAPGTSETTNLELNDFLNHLVQLRDALNSGSTASVTTAQTSLATDEDNLVNALSEHGAVQLRIEISQAQRQERQDNVGELLSSETDIDLPEAITRLNQSSVAYQAALQSMTKVMSMSLLDYID